MIILYKLKFEYQSLKLIKYVFLHKIIYPIIKIILKNQINHRFTIIYYRSDLYVKIRNLIHLHLVTNSWLLYYTTVIVFTLHIP